MTRAVVYRLDADATPQPVATAACDGHGPLLLTGDRSLFDGLKVHDPADPATLIPPSAGEAWVRALPYAIHGMLCWAALEPAG